MLVEGTRRLLRAGARAGVGHHVAISIVGCDRVPTSYYRSKVAQEKEIAAGEVPWTLLRATQVHPLIAGVFAAAARARILPTGSGLAQPVDPNVVAEHVAAAVHSAPAERLPDLAGPQVLTLTELARAWHEADGPGRTFEQWLADA